MRSNPIQVLPTVDGSIYDLVIVAAGFEERSVYCAGSRDWGPARRVAISYAGAIDDGKRENVAVLQELGFEILDLTDAEIRSVVGRELERLSEGNPTISVAIDYSSLSRIRIAEILNALDFHGLTHGVIVDFFYSPAAFNVAPGESLALEAADPLPGKLSGWLSDPTLPVAAVIGVGYEDNMGLGVAEFLDVARIYSFSPMGHDPDFDEVNNRANAGLYDSRNLVSRSEYSLLDPIGLYARLESLVYGLARQFRVNLVPLGPKPFALCAMIVALNSNAPVSVWRFSTGGMATPRTVKASGTLVRFRAIFTDRRFGSGEL